jgi:N-acetylneuraminic acid mutarotase
MKKIITILTSVLFLNAFVTAQNEWIQKACMYNVGRYAGCSFIINGSAYVGLGQTYDGKKVYDFWEYNALNNKWIKRSDYPGKGSYSATAFAVNGKGYVCLGADNSNTCQSDLWEYSPETDKWSQKASFPGRARYGASCFVIGDSVFIGTGSYGSGIDYLYDMWMYVPSTDTWEQKSDFQGYNRSHATAFAIGRSGYLGTGLQINYAATSDMWKYNVSNDSWTRIADIPGLPIMAVVSFVINNKGYIGTGYDFIRNHNEFYEYDSTSDVWSLISLPAEFEARRGSLAFSIDNIGYLATGLTNNGLLPDLWAFTPANPITGKTFDSDPKSLQIYPNPVTNTVNIESLKAGSENKISILNLYGQELIKLKSKNKSERINISCLPDGVYFIRTVNGNNIKIIKIIKE